MVTIRVALPSALETFAFQGWAEGVELWEFSVGFD